MCSIQGLWGEQTEELASVGTPKGRNAEEFFSGVPALHQLPSRMTDGSFSVCRQWILWLFAWGVDNLVTWQLNLLYSRTERLSSTNLQRIYSPYLTPTLFRIEFLSPKALCSSGQISSRPGSAPSTCTLASLAPPAGLPPSSLLHSLETFQSSFTHILSIPYFHCHRFITFSTHLLLFLMSPQEGEGYANVFNLELEDSTYHFNGNFLVGRRV